jgi:PAS domain S-box-containing protein
MSTPIRVLIVEDHADDAELMVHELHRAGFEPDWKRVDVEPDFLIALETNPDLILADWSLPQFSGWRALQIMQEHKIDIPFIIVSGTMGEDVAVEAMHEGAADYLLKDRLARLGQAVHRALEEKILREERNRAEEKLRESEYRYHLVFENSGTGNTIFDTDCRVIFQNSLSQKLTEPMNAVGKTALEIFGPKQGAIVTKRMRRVLISGVAEVFENEFTNFVERRWMHSSYQPLFDMEHQVTGIQVISQDITERKRAEEKLRESEERFRSLYENATIGMYRTSPEGGVLMANPAMVNMLGYDTFEQLSQRDLAKEGYEPGYPRHEFQNHIEKDGDVRGLESAWKRKDGSFIYVRESAHLMRGDKNQPLYYEGTVEDITERKRSEEALGESEDKFKYVFDHSVAGKSFTQVSGELNVNRAFSEMVGYSIEELNHLKWQEITHPEDVELTQNANKALLSGEKESMRFTKRFIHKNGSIVWADVATALRRNKEGKPLYFMTTFLDITERIRAEEALARSEGELRALFASMHDVVMEIDREGVYRKIAPTDPELLMKPPEDLLGKPLSEVFPPKQAEDLTNVIQKVVDTKQTTAIEYSLPIGGRTVQFETAISPLSEDSTLWVARDITARKQAEEKIVQLNAELEGRVEERTRELREAQEKIVRQEKLAVLGQLAGGVGHELRNPLGIISNAIYYLKMIQPDAEEKVRQYHAMIEREVRTSEKIITDLMDYSRLESMERSQVSVLELVQWTLMRFAVPESIKIKLKLPEDLPEVFIDMGQMQQVLGNLIINAYQAMLSPRGTSLLRPITDGLKRGELSISAKIQKGMVGIAVKDTGVGITPENMKRIFEPLFTTKSKGIGLGLAVSRKLAEANGGRIEVKSELGKGSTFTLVLPVEGGKP